MLKLFNKIEQILFPLFEVYEEKIKKEEGMENCKFIYYKIVSKDNNVVDFCYYEISNDGNRVEQIELFVASYHQMFDKWVLDENETENLINIDINLLPKEFPYE